VKLSEIDYMEAINQSLGIMDLTAFTLCMENNLPIVVFNISTRGNLKRVVMGERIGTLVRGKQE